MRPQGKVKIGFYPTPSRVVQAIARFLGAMSQNARFRLLDPCAGDGKALALLAKSLREQHEREHGKWVDFNAATYGIEIQSLLAPQAEENLDHVLQTSFFTTTLSHGDAGDRGWQCLFLNPVYDDDLNAAKGEKKEREEFKFLKRATLLLSAHGIIVYIVPQYVLRRAGVARFLSQHYDKHSCFRFPDESWRPPGSTTDVPMYEQFQQVIFIGRKRPRALPYSADDEELNGQQSQIEEWANMGGLLTPMPLEGNPTGIQYAIPNAPEIDLKYFVKGAFSPDAAAAAVGQFSGRTKRPKKGVWASDEYWSARFPNPHKVGLAVGHPLHKFKRGYLIVFAVAGLLNRAVLTGREGRRILVKGHTRKTSHYSCQDGEWEKIEKNTERHESSLWCTDLDTGDLILVETGGGTTVEWDLEYETMSMQEFLEEFGDSLMQQVLQLNAPRYQSARQVPWAKQGFSLIKRKPLGKQLDTILAQVHAYVNVWHGGGIDDDVLVSRIAEIAEMASGKTYMAICTAFLSDLYACGAVELATNVTKKLAFFPAIILTPPIMAPKWKREIEGTIPNARVLIVERFGSLHDQDEDEDEEDLLDPRQSKKSFSDASQAFRQFDPDFLGSALGTVGSVDRAVARITQDLATWQRDYDEVGAYNQAIREGTSEGELKPVPLKPCHVIILTFNTAKMMPPWTPVYQMKPVRYLDPENGKLKLAKRRDGTPALVPSCPSCGRAIKEEKRSLRELSKTGSDYQELQRQLGEERRKRSTDGLRLAQKLSAYEERLEEYLSEQAAYSQVDEERDALLRQRMAPNDPLWLSCENRIGDYLAAYPEYRALVEARDTATCDEDLLAAEERLTHLLDHHLLTSADYRVLIIQQDARIRDLLHACQAHLVAIEERLAQTDEVYIQLLAERDMLREALVREVRHLATFEEEGAEPVYLYLTEGELLGTKDHRVKRTCSECGEPLWQYVSKKPKEWTPFAVHDFLPVKQEWRTYGNTVVKHCLGSQHAKPLPLPERDFLPLCVKSTYKRRWAIADYIGDHYPNFFKFLIADEMHEGADGTALDQARQLLTSACCGRMIGLTGTLSNGYASSLFRLFYVIMRQVRQQYQYDATKQWIADHGKMQMVQKSKYEEPIRGTGSDSKRKISPGMPVYREIAGFDPTGMGLVAQRSTFTELRDVVPNLVGYSEEIQFVDMGKELGHAYRSFEQTATLELGQLLAQGDNSGLSAWYNALLIYPDMPWLGWTCQTKSGHLLGEAPALPEDVVYPIERALIDYVQEQYDKKLPVLVYTENTGQYDDQERLKYLFETKVRGRGGKKLKVAILRSTTTKKTMDREAWLERCVQDGVDVLICNPALVKVGLDLIYFKRIAYKRTPRKVSDLRQSSRRSLRPGQDTDVEVVFFAYKESMALRLLHLMARKAQSSLLVEGKIATEGLVSLGFDEEEDEGDIMGRMARDMVAALTLGTMGDSTKMAEELQELTRQSIEIERRQNQDVGEEEDLDVRVAMEEIRTATVTASANYYEDVTAPPSPVATADLPTEPIEVTKVPVSVTEDPWAGAIAVQAAQDVWAVLRQQLGPKKRSGRRK
jgi:hypothetical protein